MSKPNLIFVGCRDKMEYQYICAEMMGYNIVGILDGHYYQNQDSIQGVPVIGDERWLLDPTNQQAQQWLSTCSFIPANHWNGGQPIKGDLDLQALRKDRISILEKSGANVISLMYPGIYQEIMQSKYSKIEIGKGVFIAPDVSISAHNVSIGDYSTIYDHTRIDANTSIGKNVFVCSNAYLYECDLGDHSYFGMNAAIKIEPRLWSHPKQQNQKKIIGTNSTVWASAVVDKDVPDNSMLTHTGRIIKKRTGFPKAGETNHY